MGFALGHPRLGLGHGLHRGSVKKLRRLMPSQYFRVAPKSRWNMNSSSNGDAIADDSSRKGIQAGGPLCHDANKSRALVKAKSPNSLMLRGEQLKSPGSHGTAGDSHYSLLSGQVDFLCGGLIIPPGSVRIN